MSQSDLIITEEIAQTLVEWVDNSFIGGFTPSELSDFSECLADLVSSVHERGGVPIDAFSIFKLLVKEAVDVSCSRA